jgi:hypothetical protein
VKRFEWVTYCIVFYHSAHELAIAITYATRDWLFERPRFQRYQNELASGLSGVPASRATSKGLPLLRLLVAVAPPHDSSADFIPQQRAIFLLQNLAKWFTSEADDGEEIGDELHARLAELFLPLAPGLQNLSGAHWDFMFDVIESNLEVRLDSLLEREENELAALTDPCFGILSDDVMGRRVFVCGTLALLSCLVGNQMVDGRQRRVTQPPRFPPDESSQARPKPIPNIKLYVFLPELPELKGFEALIRRVVC